ncbi:Phage-related baseplate assembly protein [Vibrio aerogenes CECT 7868]|uniref:Phage-related baseplate assembly protein n=1 Tax=Vibrio aerogenes CECT 7868 TaxID=1216006 RepID=A0A1M5Z642_9VIBR|nr:phage baseplate assembly protein V [Vibrio aerogenes]SHI19689.1 Phage-related baseplate assembly protein [Vibrio aerogenes CECT 7868]
MVTRLKIKVGETSLNESDVYEFQCFHRVNAIPELKLAIRDGDLTQETFDRADNADFAPGKTISLNGGVDDAKHLLFEGIITAVSVRFDSFDGPRLILTAKGEAVKLAEHPVNFVSNKEIEDKALITQVAALSAGYTFKQGLKTIADNQIKHSQYAVFQQSPWRIIFSRLIENGAVFCPSPKGDSLVTLAKLQPKQAPEPLMVHEVHRCELTADTQSCFKQITATAWDNEKQALFPVAKGAAGGFKTLDKADAALGRKPRTIVCPAPKTSAQLTARANGETNFRQLDLCRGCVTASHIAIDKVAQLELLMQLDVKGAGATLAKQHLITGISHHFTPASWLIDIELGLPLNHSLYAPEAKLPPMPVMNGTIAAFKANEKLPQTLPVIVPALDAAEIYARQLTPWAGKEQGLFLQPHPGDEVLIGFIGGEGSHPVILGGCFNKNNPPPQPYDEKNNQAGLYFKDEQLSLFIDREKKSFNISVADKVKLAMTEAEGVSLGDDKNAMVLGKAADFACEGDVSIKPGGKLIVKAKGNVEVTAPKTEIK